SQAVEPLTIRPWVNPRAGCGTRLSTSSRKLLRRPPRSWGTHGRRPIRSDGDRLDLAGKEAESGQRLGDLLLLVGVVGAARDGERVDGPLQLRELIRLGHKPDKGLIHSLGNLVDDHVFVL